jgi:kinesin family protein 11
MMSKSSLQVNQKISKTAHIKELNAEMDRLKAELNATREKNGIYLPADQYEQREELSKNNVARLENMEAEMEQMGTKSKEEFAKLEQRISDLQKVITRPSCDPAAAAAHLRDGA